MPELGGYGGDVTFVGGYVTNVKEWNIDYSVEALDSTDFASAGEGDVVRGIRSWTGTYKCSLDDTVVIIAPGLVGAAVFTATGARTYTGTMMLTNVSFGASTAGLMEVTCSFRSKTLLAIN